MVNTKILTARKSFSICRYRSRMQSIWTWISTMNEFLLQNTCLPFRSLDFCNLETKTIVAADFQFKKKSQIISMRNVNALTVNALLPVFDSLYIYWRTFSRVSIENICFHGTSMMAGRNQYFCHMRYSWSDEWVAICNPNSPHPERSVLMYQYDGCRHASHRCRARCFGLSAQIPVFSISFPAR